MLRYTFYVIHDKGSKKISVVSTSLDIAIVILSMAENCPKSAIQLKSILPA